MLNFLSLFRGGGDQVCAELDHVVSFFREHCFLYLEYSFCRAIHEGMDCREHQRRVAEQAETSEDAKKTQKFLDVSHLFVLEM